MFGFMTKNEFREFKNNDFRHLVKKVERIQWWVISTLFAIVLTLIAVVVQGSIPIILGG